MSRLGASRQQLAGVHEGQIAEQDGESLRHAPLLTPPTAPVVVGGIATVDGRLMPTGVAAVHHIVVDERKGVQHLDGRSQSHQLFAGRIAAPAHEPPVGEPGPQALAAPEHERR